MVTEKESVMTVHEGTLQVMAPDGTQLVQPGQSIHLAQSQMTPPPTQQGKTTDRRKAAALWWGGNDAAWTIGGLAVGFAGIIAPAVVIGTSGGDNEVRAASPF